jgi:hypothetical protein
MYALHYSRYLLNVSFTEVNQNQRLHWLTLAALEPSSVICVQSMADDPDMLSAPAAFTCPSSLTPAHPHAVITGILVAPRQIVRIGCVIGTENDNLLEQTRSQQH